jgi:lysophospholipase
MTHLRTSEHNQAPDLHAEGFVETPDGFDIRYAVFRTSRSRTNGTVVLLHGRNEIVEKYFETISDLTDAGLDVLTFDWRGQGGSTRFFPLRPEPGYVDTFDQYAVDLDAVFSEVVLPDCRPPFFILAHSTGALIALYSAPVMVNRVRRMVLASPFLGLPVPAYQASLSYAASAFMRFLGLGNVYVAGGPPERFRKPFEANRVTSDPERYARNQELVARYPALALGGPAAAWTAAVLEAMDRVNESEHMARTTIPTLIVVAGADNVVSNPAIERHAAKLRSASVLTIDGARHEIMQEADRYRDQFLAAFLAFVPGSGD